MSEPQRVRLRIPRSAQATVICGGILSGVCFVIVGWLFSVLQPATPAWGVFLGVVAAVVGLAGARERETPFGKGLFVAIAGGVVLFWATIVFADLVFAIRGGWAFGALYAAVVVNALFTPAMGVLCAVVHKWFPPGTN